jgi:hypothetical protein
MGPVFLFVASGRIHCLFVCITGKQAPTESKMFKDVQVSPVPSECSWSARVMGVSHSRGERRVCSKEHERGRIDT